MHRAPERGRGRGQQPVVNVDWDDAQAYVAWLSQVTSKTYRLLSRPNTNMRRARGRKRSIRGETTSSLTALPWPTATLAAWDHTKTAPVGSFAPNRFGLYDMVGSGQRIACITITTERRLMARRGLLAAIASTTVSCAGVAGTMLHVYSDRRRVARTLP